MSDIYSGRAMLMPKYSGATPHLWVILTEPEGDPPRVVIVNLTSRKPDSDTTVLLNVGDHRFINHETVVYYADARFATAAAIEQLSKFPNYGFHDDCSETLLERIKAGLLISKATPKKIKDYCQTRF